MSNVSNENNLTQYVIVVDDQRLSVIHNVELRHNRYHKTYFTSESGTKPAASPTRRKVAS